MFKADTGRELDTSNQFQDLRRMLRGKADRLCTGPAPRATQRRKDMSAILVQAARILKAEDKKWEEVTKEREAVEALKLEEIEKARLAKIEELSQ